MPVAIITGATRGLGRALTTELVRRGWRVVADARRAGDLEALVAELGPAVIAVPGDVADSAHRAAVAGAARGLGRIDLVVNNASTLGATPLPPLSRYPVEAFDDVLLTNVLAPLALTQLVLPELRRTRGTVVNVSSDAVVEAYPGWGGYGASKAALDQLSAVLGVEEPELHVYAFDPGDMRTDMHAAAFPGEDISDRPEPESVVPSLLRLIDDAPPSGRYRGADVTGLAQVGS